MTRCEKSLTQLISEEYHQFLGELGQAICDKISVDEGVDALREMENKEYLLERIKEIIQGVYESKGQEKIARLIQEREVYKSMVEERQTQIQELKQQIEHLQQQIQQLNQQKPVSTTIPLNTSVDQNQPQQKQSLSSNLVWQYQKQLIQQDQQHKIRLKQLTQTIHILQSQHKSTQSQLTLQLQSAVQGIKLWEDKYKQVYQQKTLLQNTLEQQIQNKIQEQLKNKQLTQQKQRIQLNVQNMNKLNKNIKQQLQQLQDKLICSQHKQSTLQEQISTYQQEIRILKKINDQLNVQNEGKTTYQSASIQGQAATVLKSLKEVEQTQKRTQTQDRQRRIFQLQKKLQKVKSLKNQLQLQYHQFKLQKDKRIFQLQQQNNELKISYEKQLRTVKNTFMKQKQTILQSHQETLKSIKSSSNNKQTQKITQLQKQIIQLQQKITKQKHNYTQLQTLMGEKQLHYNQTIRETQHTNQQLNSYIKQLQKTINQKNTNNTEFMKQYVKRVQLSEEQTQRYRKQNQKMRKQVQSLTKQINSLNHIIDTQRNKEIYQQTQNRLTSYKKQQFQHHIKKIAEIKQKLFLTQTQNKHIEKQLSQKVQQIQQLKCKNTKLQQLTQKLKDKQSKQQKQLAQMRKQLTDLQSQHHKQITHIYKTHQQKIQIQKKTISQHYQMLLRNRQDKINQYKTNNSVIEYQLDIERLKSIINQMKQRVNNYENKVQQLFNEIKQLKKQLSTKQQIQESLKQQLNQSNRQLFNIKEQKMKLKKNIQSKLQYDKQMFRQFKCEVYNYLKKQLDQIRSIINNILKSFKHYENQWNQNKDKLTIMFYSHLNNYQSLVDQKLNSIKLYYQSQLTVTHKIQLQELHQQYTQKLKQKQIQTLAQIATRQIANQQLQKSISNLKLKLQKTQQKLKLKQDQSKTIKQQLKTIKQVHQKLTQKSLKFQKFTIDNQRYITQITNQNNLLKKQLIQTQQNYHDQLQKCRQKYIQENQKLFNKYQKQFDKLITMNNKTKNSTLSSIMISNIPTKQFQTIKKYQDLEQRPNKQSIIYDKKQPVSQKQQSKLDKIRKEILLQKKKLQSLDATKVKPSLKGSTSMSNLNKFKNI